MMMMTDPVQCSPVLAPKKADLSQPSRVDGSWVLLNKMSMNDDDDLSVMWCFGHRLGALSLRVW